MVVFVRCWWQGLRRRRTTTGVVGSAGLFPVVVYMRSLKLKLTLREFDAGPPPCSLWQVAGGRVPDYAFDERPGGLLVLLRPPPPWRVCSSYFLIRLLCAIVNLSCFVLFRVSFAPPALRKHEASAFFFSLLGLFAPPKEHVLEC